MKTWSIGLLFLAGLQVTWAGLSISPTQLYIEKKQQRSTTVTLVSKGLTDTKIFEATAVKWTQNEKGEDVLDPISDIIINPKNFIIKPESSQIVRVGFRALPTADTQEAAWRIIFTEVTPVAKKNEDSVSFLLNLSVPLFVGKQLPIDIKITPIVKSENTFLNIQNNGNSHVQIFKISIIDTNKKTITNNSQMKYLLAKQSYQFNLGHINIKDWHKYKILIKTDKNENPLEFNIRE